MVFLVLVIRVEASLVSQTSGSGRGLKITYQQFKKQRIFLSCALLCYNVQVVGAVTEWGHSFSVSLQLNLYLSSTVSVGNHMAHHCLFPILPFAKRAPLTARILSVGGAVSLSLSLSLQTKKLTISHIAIVRMKEKKEKRTL